MRLGDMTWIDQQRTRLLRFALKLAIERAAVHAKRHEFWKARVDEGRRLLLETELSCRGGRTQ